MIRDYISLIFLFVPGAIFCISLSVFKNPELPYEIIFSSHFIIIIVSGTAGTAAGVLDWNYHRKVLGMKISKRERKAEAAALGLGGIPMSVLLASAMHSSEPKVYLLPVISILVFTAVLVCYDEFVFHRKRCSLKETVFHRILVFGNTGAFLAWFHLIFIK